MGMPHGLPGGSADVDPDIAALRSPVLVEAGLELGDEAPDVRLLLGCQGKEVSDMPPRNDEAMPRVERIAVKKRCRAVVASDHIPSRNALAEGAGVLRFIRRVPLRAGRRGRWCGAGGRRWLGDPGDRLLDLVVGESGQLLSYLGERQVLLLELADQLQPKQVGAWLILVPG